MITDAERRQILHNAIAWEVSMGNRVAWVGLYEAHIWRMPAKVNHVVHGVLSLLTMGGWLVVWALVALSQPKPKRVGIFVNESGQVQQFVVPVIQPTAQLVS